MKDWRNRWMTFLNEDERKHTMHDGNFRVNSTNFIDQIISERDKELNYCLYALAIMYNQYVGEEGHLFMSAGETAVDVLESHGLLCADVIGRGKIPYEKYTSLINE